MMKHYLICIGFLLSGAGISFAQEVNSKLPRQIFTAVEQAPAFPGGPDVLRQFLARHIRYPKSAYKNDIEGKVVVRFIIEADGTVSDPEIMQALDPDCDKETLRVIRKMPKWNPGRHNGAFVATYYQLPVTFSLR